VPVEIVVEREVYRELPAAERVRPHLFFFFFTLVTGPRRSLSLKTPPTLRMSGFDGSGTVHTVLTWLAFGGLDWHPKLFG